MEPRSDRRRLTILSIAMAAVVVLATVLAIALTRPDTEVTPTPTPEHTEAADPYRLPAGEDPARPAIHLTPAQHWMNDPQRPFFLDGLWHFYYLYNADHPDGNGTAWYHATSPDLVHWTDRGVAIDKYTNGLGDIWTGTAVVDRDNTAGFGAGAVIALVTQQHDGVQRQSLFFSTDGGDTFASYDGNPVMDNPGTPDWRDPRVLWDEAAGQWVMALAEGERIGFYTSPDLKAWTYRSDVTATDLGVLECPDLFAMSVDGDPDRVQWILMAGANGEAEGMTTGTVYWTGAWDGERFTPDEQGHRWLDRGADYYAAVTWDDPSLSDDDRLAQRYGIGWLNNWAYAGQVPGEQFAGGSDSIIRELRLVSDGDATLLASTPSRTIDDLAGPALETASAVVEPGATISLGEPDADAYRLTVDLQVEESTSEARIRIPRGDGFATVGYDAAAGEVFVARDADAIAGDMPEAYRVVRTAPESPRDGVVRLDIIVDAASIEVFTGSGRATLSMVSGQGAERREASAIGLGAERGTVTLAAATLVPLRAAPVARAE